MLIGARDGNGRPLLMQVQTVEVCMFREGIWDLPGDGVSSFLLEGDEAEPFCQNIPPGQSRVIDLSASTIVHVQPVKTAVEELVEACEFMAGDARHWGPCLQVDRPVFEAMESALARVRQEGGA